MKPNFFGLGDIWFILNFYDCYAGIFGHEEIKCQPTRNIIANVTFPSTATEK
jgi:hypothetical protein